MATSRFISLNNGILQEVVPATTSAGASSAGQVVALNASGLVDPSMLPAASGSSVVKPIPRDNNWYLGIANPAHNRMDEVGLYSGNSTGTFTYTVGLDTAGYNNMAVATGTTLGTKVGYVGAQQIIANNPSFRAIYNLPSLTAIQATIGINSYVQTSVAGVANPGATSGQAIAGFRYFSNLDGSNWQVLLGDYTTTTVMDSGVAVNTARMQIFDVIWVSGLPQFYIDGVRVASAISTTNLPATSAAMGGILVHTNTTATNVSANIHMLYYGNN